MPGFNRTGPLGEGARTGRGLGKCSNPGRGAANRLQGGNGMDSRPAAILRRGRCGRGRGPGSGRGGGRGNGRGGRAAV